MTADLTPAAADLTARAALHRALGDETRLQIVDALQLSDRSPKELGALTGVPANLLAFHLNVLEECGLVARTASQGDARRRYVRLRGDALTGLLRPSALPAAVEDVLFVCTANSARSPLAAGLWQARTGRSAGSAGLRPADRVDPRAVAVARRHGIDLSDAVPRSYDAVGTTPDLVVSVCDRAREASLSFAAPLLHWSIDDPAGGDTDAFERAIAELDERIGRLARAAGAA